MFPTPEPLSLRRCRNRKQSEREIQPLVALASRVKEIPERQVGFPVKAARLCNFTLNVQYHTHLIAAAPVLGSLSVCVDE